MGFCASRPDAYNKNEGDDLVTSLHKTRKILTLAKQSLRRVRVNIKSIEKHLLEEESDCSARLSKYEKVSSFRREYKPKYVTSTNSIRLNKEKRRNRKQREYDIYEEENDCKRSTRTFAELVLLAEEEDELEEMKRNIKTMRKVARRYLTIVCKKQRIDFSDYGK